MEVPSRDGHADIAAALRALADKGLTRILCEGGASLAAALIRARLADDLALFSAGTLLGADAQAALAPLGLQALKDAPRLTRLTEAAAGPDTLTLWRF